MTTPDRPNRAIIYEPQYVSELEAIEPDQFRADECLQGLLWVLVQDPTQGFRSNDPDVWYFPLVRRDFPPVYVFYAFNDEKLCFLSIRRLDEGNGHGQ